jgi:hypothetical protein
MKFENRRAEKQLGRLFTRLCCNEIVVSFVPAISSLKDVVLEIEPEIVHLGEDSTLRCSYDLEDAPLYCVKWYRGRHEFYRYTPKEHPSTKIFPFPGVHVDVSIKHERTEATGVTWQKDFSGINPEQLVSGIVA